jgi:hypothetical protein
VILIVFVGLCFVNISVLMRMLKIISLEVEGVYIDFRRRGVSLTAETDDRRAELLRPNYVISSWKSNAIA